jgi:hypothetical protein
MHLFHITKLEYFHDILTSSYLLPSNKTGNIHIGINEYKKSPYVYLSAATLDEVPNYKNYVILWFNSNCLINKPFQIDDVYRSKPNGEITKTKDPKLIEEKLVKLNKHNKDEVNQLKEKYDPNKKYDCDGLIGIEKVRCIYLNQGPWEFGFNQLAIKGKINIKFIFLIVIVSKDKKKIKKCVDLLMDNYIPFEICR